METTNFLKELEKNHRKAIKAIKHMIDIEAQEYPEYKFVMSYIMDDFNTMFDQPQYTLVHAGKGGYGADGFDTSEDTTTAKFCASTMSKFNSDEWSTGFMDGVNTPYG